MNETWLLQEGTQNMWKSTVSDSGEGHILLCSTALDYASRRGNGQAMDSLETQSRCDNSKLEACTGSGFSTAFWHMTGQNPYKTHKDAETAEREYETLTKEIIKINKMTFNSDHVRKTLAGLIRKLNGLRSDAGHYKSSLVSTLSETKDSNRIEPEGKP
jgi:phosphatidylinositol kinase/protein kinase (PI-3  family)